MNAPRRRLQLLGISLVGIVAVAASLVGGQDEASADRWLSPDEYNALLGKCLDAHGTERTMTAQGSLITDSYGSEQVTECHHEFQHAGLVPSADDVTPEMLGESYDNASLVRACLREMGYPDSPDWPDRDTFINGDATLQALYAGVPEQQIGSAIYTCDNV